VEVNNLVVVVVVVNNPSANNSRTKTKKKKLADVFLFTDANFFFSKRSFIIVIS
jgi:hypothetical protein